MTVDQADILKRIDELLITDTREKVAQLPHGGVSLLSLVYGEDSIQVKHFRARLADISRQHENHIRRENAISNEAIGALKNLKREIEAGLTGSLRQQVTGEVLTDFIQLARAVLNLQTDGAKNVAAVLAAAAFEDTIRRMGATLAGVIGEDDLSDVLKRLKDAGAIQSPQVGIAQSYLSFRNQALHANWDKIERESIHSVLGFVEQLLLKHFA
jgi:hypothetical protein